MCLLCFTPLQNITRIIYHRIADHTISIFVIGNRKSLVLTKSIWMIWKRATTYNTRLRTIVRTKRNRLHNIIILALNIFIFLPRVHPPLLLLDPKSLVLRSTVTLMSGTPWPTRFFFLWKRVWIFKFRKYIHTLCLHAGERKKHSRESVSRALTRVTRIGTKAANRPKNALFTQYSMNCEYVEEDLHDFFAPLCHIKGCNNKAFGTKITKARYDENNNIIRICRRTQFHVVCLKHSFLRDYAAIHK